MEKYIIEQVAECRWFYNFTEVNERGETLTIELTHCKVNSSPNSLPTLWKKNGLIDRVLDTYWSVNTYVKDTEGNCFGKYNPQDMLKENGKGLTINFDWIFEATEENKEKLINEVYKLFSSAKGKSATEEKNEAIKSYAIKNNIDIYKTIPNGWKKTNRIAALRGIVWISNMEPFLSGNLKNAILLAD